MLQDTKNDGDLSDVCRVCLGVGVGVRMYHMWEHGLSAVYARVTGIVTNTEDKLPQQLCWECVARLSSANNFIVKALRAHGILSNIIASGRILTVHDITSIDRAQHRLESRLRTSFINDDQNNSHSTQNSIVTDIKTELLSDLDNNDSYNEYSLENDNLNPKQEDNADAEVMYNDAAAQTCNLKDLNHGIDSVNTAVVDAGDTPAAANVYVVTIQETESDDKLTFIVKDENVIKHSAADLIDDKSNRKALQVEQQMEDPKTLINKKRNNTLLGCKEAIVVLEDFRLSKFITQDTQACYELPSASAPTPTTAKRRSDVKKIKEEEQDITEETRGSSDVIVAREEESINTKHISDLDSHTEFKQNLFICDICRKTFRYKNSLIKHIQNHPKFYNCKYCTYKSRAKGHLNRHTNSKHLKSTSYKCSYCSYITFRKSCLRAHVNCRHTKSTSYNCSHCSYKTYKKCDLSLHINSKHTKSKSYNCSHCSYKTCKKSNLSAHINSRHTKSTSYNCTYCSYKAYRASNLSLHINNKHTKSTSYNCSHCSYKAYRKGVLSYHLKSKHAKIQI